MVERYSSEFLARELLEEFCLPDIKYPVIADYAELRRNGSYAFLSALLLGLQEQSSADGVDWLQLENAMCCISSLIAPIGPSELSWAAGSNWWLELGPVNLLTKIVTIQRGENLIAAIEPTVGGRLRAAVYRPLDAKSASYLIGLSMLPHAQTRVSMRENNWEYALDASAGTGNWYAADRGQAYLSFWNNGIGKGHDGKNFPIWSKYVDIFPRSSAEIWAELAVRPQE